MSEATVTALRELLETSRGKGANYLYALEINKTKARVDPSFTWQGVEEIVRTVDDARLGICWDFGHAHCNFLQGLIEAEPPENFVRKVIHTHIHDLGPENGTHWPLGNGGVRVEESCRRLMGKGYGGVFNLELELRRYKHEEMVAERIIASIERLARLVERA